MKTIWPKLIVAWIASSISIFSDETSNHGIPIPITLSHGRVILTARINESKPLTFLLDTGCTIPTFHPDLADELGLKASSQVTISGIAGDERAPTYRGVKMDLGGAIYAPRRIACIPSEREERRHRDGVVGSGFFSRFVVEIDSRKKLMTLHSPTNFVYQGRGEIVPFFFRDEIPVIKAAVLLKDKPEMLGEFQVDTGCDSGLCLGERFVKSSGILDGINTRSDEKFGLGGSRQTRNGKIPALRLGKLEIKDAQADFFLNGSPVDEPAAGHIGVGILNRYKVIYDYSRRQMILEE